MENGGWRMEDGGWRMARDRETKEEAGEQTTKELSIRLP